jgi:DNA adenine methylase
MLSSPSAAIAPRPFLKWAGGKSQLLQQYNAFWPRSFQTYYEPFLGGGAVFFHLSDRIQSAWLTDINPELVNVYRCVQQRVDDLIALLSHHRRNHCADHYYAIRQTQFQDPLERAARLIYLNKTCFNGLYRENSKGQFNVPMGSYKNPGIFDPDVLYAAAAALCRTTIDLQSFDQVVLNATSAKDFVYFDPPYFPISATSNFTGYNRYAFTAEDHTRLRDTFVRLAECGVQVMLSNSDCEFVRNLYDCDRAYIHSITATRLINCKAKRRGRISELLITSYPVS